MFKEIIFPTEKKRQKSLVQYMNSLTHPVKTVTDAINNTF